MTNLIDLYHFYAEARRRGTPAFQAHAYANAKRGESIVCRYPGNQIYKYAGNSIYGAFNDDGERFVERPTENGFRFVGFCDDLTHAIAHTGWFCDEFQDSKFRGAVYQMATRDGKWLFVPAYVNDWNDGVLMDFGNIQTESVYETSDHTDSSAANSAAHCADSLAERAAEKERDYQIEERERLEAEELEAATTFEIEHELIDVPAHVLEAAGRVDRYQEAGDGDSDVNILTNYIYAISTEHGAR